MLFNALWLLSISSVALAAVTPFKSVNQGLYRRQNGTYTTSACAAVSASVAAQAAVATPTVPAQLAYDCIQSVPLNASAALRLLDTIKPYINWQSTIAYLKDPPAEYVEKIQQPVDVWGGIADIEQKLTAGAWTKEYEFGWALYHLFQSTHDGHFVFVPDSIGGIFTWGRRVALVSVSEDGLKLPEIYVYGDILAASYSNASYTPSAIAAIDGQNATAFLENWSEFGSLQDRDALYNNVFFELAQTSLGPSGNGLGTFAGGGRGRWVYPGATTTLTFANGTSTTYTNFARVLVNFTGVDSGESLYQKYFTTPDDGYFNLANLTQPNSNSTNVTQTSVPTTTPAATRSSAPTATSTTTTARPGYPTPVIVHNNNLNGGYFIDDPDYSDVAVLSVPSFVSRLSAELQFQYVNQYFLAAAKAAGKTKLIIDVSANGGGTILQGYDLFLQLFPTIDPEGYQRFRAHQAADLIGQRFSEISGQYPRSLDVNDSAILDIETSPFDYRSDLTVDGRKFSSWEEKYGPHEFHGDNFTSIFRWDLDDPLITLNSGGINITGHQNRTGFTQPFQAENIVVVTDGYCASTCTIFSEFMRQQANVKYISLGGRPRYGITQAVGGVKGTNVLGYADIQYYAELTYNFSTATEQAYYNTTELGRYNSRLPFYRSAQSVGPVVNFRDGLRKGDPSQTPLQFIYEPADCRIFYTPEMTVDVTAIWKAVADSAWGGAGKSACVAGSLGNATSPTPYRKRAVMPRLKLSTLAQLERSLEDIHTDASGLWGDCFTMP